VRNELARGSHIRKLVAFSRDSAVEKSNEATEELAELSKYGVVCQIFTPGKLISSQLNSAKKSSIKEA
jgi:hypothetical protein